MKFTFIHRAYGELWMINLDEVFRLVRKRK